LIGWKALTLIGAALALLWQTRPAYAVAYLMLLFFFAAPNLLERSAKKLIVSRRGGEQYLFPGDEGQVSLVVQNPTVLPFAWISILDSIPRNLVLGTRLPKPVFSLGPKQSREVAFPLLARERGVYRLGPLELFVGDFFGISTWRHHIAAEQTIVVYPQVRSLPELALPSRLSFGNFPALQRIHPDPTRLAGVRPYEQGDPLRTIHWPASARTQALQVKQFDHTVTVNCRIFLDFCQDSYSVSQFFPATERAVTTAASLAAHIIQRGEACGLATNAVLNEYLPESTGISYDTGHIHLRPRQGAQQLSEILSILAGVCPQNQKDFLTLVQESSDALEQGTILLWVVPRDTPEVLKAAADYVRQGRQVSIFAVEKVLHPELLHAAPGSALQVFEVSMDGEVTR
jgi:uncharacterized protein (DUF58 family)